ncbi:MULTISPECIES: hypothetical protein [Blautia]|uniref:Uncharacterized protein n=2 Tax=Blautia TaxID=572511 RepID=A0ABQ0BSF4_9FIRM|nr:MULTISPECIES: hypothetical protein [Blautia]MCI5963636.1 hypothetical protein [Clostridia bacterium]MBC5672552.1 hypothetical protein [Blautia celeris]MCB4355411.1 hypothetical protein [Blautia sp. RD014232]MCJ8020539.1 hypothetical protein [Blautia sp. NSJ-159]MCJ8043434.1 hypothetical protein [Blautia sp. NSJ-165]
MDNNKKRIKIVCPYCGYKMPIAYDPARVVCQGVYIQCKGRKCKKEFEIRI